MPIKVYIYIYIVPIEYFTIALTVMWYYCLCDHNLKYASVPLHCYFTYVSPISYLFLLQSGGVTESLKPKLGGYYRHH